MGLSIWGTLSSVLDMLSCWDDHWRIAVLSLTVTSLNSSFWDRGVRPADFADSEERKCWIEVVISEAVRVVARKAVADIASRISSDASFMIIEAGMVQLLVVGQPVVVRSAGSSVGGGFLLPVLGGGSPRLAMSLRGVGWKQVGFGMQASKTNV